MNEPVFPPETGYHVYAQTLPNSLTHPLIHTALELVTRQLHKLMERRLVFVCCGCNTIPAHAPGCGRHKLRT